MTRVDATEEGLESFTPTEVEGSTAANPVGKLLVDLTDEEAVVSLSSTERRTVPFVDLAGEYEGLRPAIDLAIQGVLNRTDFVLGQAVTDFENDFAEFCDVRHAVGVDSGFSALELILRAHDIGPGDEVITVANTFVATVAAIESCGATPVLVDMHPDTYNLDPDHLADAITARTRAIIPVHLYGRPADVDAISPIAKEHGLWVFEDACQAHGAKYRGRTAGSLGHAAAFSFYPSKNLGAYGDGGMIVTGNEEISERIRLLRNLGSSSKYRHEVKGFNHRLDTLQAAVLGVKLEHLPAWNESRRRTARIYDQLLEDLPLKTPNSNDDIEPVYHLYVIEVSDRARLQQHLGDAGVATGIHYPVPVHMQPAYQQLGSGLGSYPASESAAEKILSLPMYPNMSIEDTAYVAHVVRDFYAG